MASIINVARTIHFHGELRLDERGHVIPPTWSIECIAEDAGDGEWEVFASGFASRGAALACIRDQFERFVGMRCIVDMEGNWSDDQPEIIDPAALKDHAGYFASVASV